MKRTPRGFTLIEIMVTMVILSILVGFAADAFLGEKQREMIDVQSKNEALLNKALNDFFWTQGRYPSRLIDLVERQHPWFDELPIDPFTEKADWLVLHKTGKMKGQAWMNQSDFPIAGIPVAETGETEGIFIVKHR